MACNRRLPPSPLGRNSSLLQRLHREENRRTREEKPSEVKIESSEKARGTDAGVNKRKPIRRPRSKRPYLLQTKPWQENLKVLRAAAACVYINKQTPEQNPLEDDASSSGCSNVKDFETDCDDNIGVHLLAEVATGISLGVEEKEEHGMEKSKLKRSL
ncbi:uncharacterized protein LOC114164854 [Vigna unguiculata]|uniref:Uncharacterized protein n=1 Tax=Vigna unguiculata TaxID=3917 RepID=A0A4D6NQL2_VIGUN|nr:uncharacterized protein LOC114164854 [Vigna unguiculata]QCE15668.1 hypothetical protein DEO72_LG11g2680 [Vigna unguiculata]